MELNIVELIEKNPITKLSNTQNGKLVNKVKESFTNYEQQLFITSFFCYLNYNKNTDFIIDLDKVWGWLDFKRKENAKYLLGKYFKLGIDYKILDTDDSVTKKHGGSNIKKIMMTVKTFKLLCLKAGTSKAEVLHEIIEEESIELKMFLERYR